MAFQNKTLFRITQPNNLLLFRKKETLKEGFLVMKIKIYILNYVYKYYCQFIFFFHSYFHCYLTSK